MLFTVADAQASGISRGVLRGTRYRQVLGPVYVDGKVAVTPRLQAEAALLLTPGAVVSHETALSLWTANDRADDVVHVTVQRDPRLTLPRVSGLRVHEVQRLDQALRDGLPLTSPERTFLDLAPYCDLTKLVAAGDSLVRRTDVEPHHLVEAVAAAIGVRGVRLAREAAGLVRGGVDSPMESLLRLLIVFGGLPEPQIGYVITDTAGGWLAEPDLSYPEVSLRSSTTASTSWTPVSGARSRGDWLRPPSRVVKIGSRAQPFSTTRWVSCLRLRSAWGRRRRGR